MSKKEAKEQDKKKAKEPAKKPGRRKEKALPAIIDMAPASPIEKATTPDIESFGPNPSELVPYDENLLERSRTQWQFGDWESLAKLERDTLQHHPDRAKLALLAAAGHQQLGNMAAARQFTRLAQDWGCSKRLVSQILIAGVHNTLGRATASIGKSTNALKHFEAAIATGTPGSDIRLLIQARVDEQLRKMGLPYSYKLVSSDSTYAVTPTHFSSIDNAMHELTGQLQKQNTELVEQITKLNADLLNVRKQLENTINKELLNTAKQLEAFLGVQSFLHNGEHIPGMHGWPISPDFALYMIELIDQNDYDLIIEFGSGTSTVLIAKALVRITARRQNKVATVQVAFEHLQQYYAQTQAHLQQAGLIEHVQLVLAPLQPYSAPNGNTYSYYSCQDTLAEMAKHFPEKNLRILIIVDGPPGKTGKNARYPALPTALTHFKKSNIDILLDDYIRDDEKEIVDMWLMDLKKENLNYKIRREKMEKDACLISI